MSFLKEYIENLRELVNLDAGTANTAGVTRAAQIMKGHFESIALRVNSSISDRVSAPGFWRATNPMPPITMFFLMHTSIRSFRTEQLLHAPFPSRAF